MAARSWSIATCGASSSWSISQKTYNATCGASSSYLRPFIQRVHSSRKNNANCGGRAIWQGFHPERRFASSASSAEVQQVTVADRITQARAKMKDKSSQAQETATFVQIFAVLLPSSVAVWFFLWAARWRYSDAERMKALESQPGGSLLLDVLSSRFASHLGPYQVPNLVSARTHEEPLRALAEPLPLDHERTRALGRLEQLSMRRVAAQQLAPPGEEIGPGSGMRALQPLFLDLLASAPKDSPDGALSASASHQTAALRIVFDVVCATPPEERAVESWVLSGLVLARASPWDQGPKMEEARVALLLMLLQSPENCKTAATLPELCTFLEQPGQKQKEDTIWPLKAYLLSGETVDLLRRCARLINKQVPGSVDAQSVKARRDTPSLQVKHDLRNFWTTALLTISWASFCSWRGVADVANLLSLSKSVGAALGGMFVVESVWRAEEYVIQSDQYFKEPTMMYAISAAMCLLNCLAWSWAFRNAVAVPFIACRVLKDDFMDAYRIFAE